MTDPAPQVGRPGTMSGATVVKIETIIESVYDSVHRGKSLSIPFTRRKPVGPRGRPRLETQEQILNALSGPRTSDVSSRSRPAATVSFPGKNEAESRLFTDGSWRMVYFNRKLGSIYAQVLSILQLSHQALLSDTYVTKRSIFYQYPELFKEQRIVDGLVDDIAFTLGLGRDSLHIVAASVGIVCGALRLTRQDGTECFASGENGIAIPPIREIQDLDVSRCEWILVIEKEATFRTLAAAGYADTSAAGPGALVTSKGYPTLVTRCFLNHIQKIAPQLPIYGLVDYDPHGLRIFQTYKYGSQSLNHEEDTTIPGLQWLGLKSHDFLACNVSNPSNEPSSQPLEDVLPLSEHDRRVGACLLANIMNSKDFLKQKDSALEQCREVQVMLMLNVKAEIQAADEYGDLTEWLDKKLYI